ncbi:DUF748 domain-containing protein [Desulfobacter curvatus]|uniref:DUF748 domain-containing protein n=1 Tax=Desulfobacter curvatus TaxID=2290 RepID=UPI00036E1A08|nr:DUF748 domain-containing protein [Desulfobacter curvatus]
MKKYFTVKKVALSAAALFIFYLLLTGLVAPWAGKRIAVNSLTETLGRQTRIESISFNPFTLEARVKNFSIESKINGENLASVQEIYLNLSTTSLFHLAPVISDIQVTAPEFSLHLNKDNTLNISDLLEGQKTTAAPEPETAEDEPGALFEIKVSNVKITGGALVFTDHIRSVTHSVAQLNFDLPFVSTMEKDLATPIKAVMSCLMDKARVDVDVTGVPFDVTRKLSFSLNMLPLDLNTFAPYIDLPAPYKIKSAGNLALTVSGQYEIPNGKAAEDQMLAVNLKTLVKNIDLDSVAGGNLFACPQLTVEASSRNVFDMNFLVDKMSIGQASLFVERNAQGGINLIPPGPGTKAASPPQTSTRTPDALNSGTQAEVSPDQAAQADTAAAENETTQADEIQSPAVSADYSKIDGADAAPPVPHTVANENVPASSEQIAEIPSETDTGGVPVIQNQAAPVQENNDSLNPVIALSLPFTVTINQAAVKRMHIRFRDKMVSPEVVKEISSLDFILTDVHLGAKAAGKYDLHILTGDDEEIKTAGDFHIQNDLAVNGTVSVNGIDLNNFRPYLAPYLGDNVTLENVAAALNFKVGLSQAGLGVNIADGRVILDKFGLTEQGKKEPLAQFDQLALSRISCNLLKQEAEVGLVELHKAQVEVNRDKNGRMDLLTAIEQALKTGADSGQTVTTAKPVQTKQALTTQGEQNVSAPAWIATIHKTVLDRCQAQFIDQAKKEPVKVIMKDIGVTVENISTKKGEKATFKASMTNKNEGEINLDGSFDISGPAATVNIDLNRIDVNTAEPYFTDFLKISISKGYLDTKGTVVMTPAKKKNDPPTITYKGRVSLNNFLSKNKVDDTDFFACKSLYATGMDISVNPMKVIIKEIALTDFYQRAILNKDAQLNYKEIMVEQPEDKTAAKNKPKNRAASGKENGSAMPDIRIDAITLQGGHINFSDYFTKPNFTANMTEIAGSLTGLSSRGNTHAQLVLKGVHGGYAPLDITGQVDPLKDNRFVDLTISFKNIELPKFNVYSKKFLGYEIEKGKLILDLHYNIDQDKLNSSNRVLFDQLTLGKKVDSKDATSLPIEFAISLLKNSKGEIDLDLPITGDISDPKFHFGKVVGTVLRNFIMGIVTAPFKFLGNLVGVGSGQDLGYVTFDPGKSRLGQAQKEKLDKLITVLGKKPSLKLEIMSLYNNRYDGEQLRYEAFEAMVLSLDKKLPADGTVKLADLDEEKRTRLIEKSYDRAQFPKPRDASGKEKELTLDEKEKLLVTSMPLDGDALSALGRERGHEVARYLTETGKIDIRRVFVTEPDPVAEDEENNARIKATFNLK